MGLNLEKIIDSLDLAEERRDSFIKNLRGLARLSEKEKGYRINPEVFWDDSSSLSLEEKDHLWSWLRGKAREAAENVLQNYDYRIAPGDLDELEEEITEIQIASQIREVIQLKKKYRFPVVHAEDPAKPYLEYLDGRKLFI